MKEKYKRRTSDCALEKIDAVAAKFGVERDFAEVLTERGLADDKPNQDERDGFFEPFSMSNMDKAAELLNNIIKRHGKALICGDYDSDGLTASAILKLFLNDNGVYADVLIPTREEGYGLHLQPILEKFGTIDYDLLITVDCGISEADTIKNVIEKTGADVLVTDHHEPPEILPKCVCINPKLGYPFANLCGAGVVFKLVQAVAGFEAAALYADLAAVGTVADMMPLESENRSLVRFGLKNFNHRGLKKLAELSKCGGELSASALAMKICPKINSAGRIGDPYIALEVLLMRERAESDKVAKLNECNTIRQEMLERTVAQANEKLAGLNIADSKIIVCLLYTSPSPRDS